MSKAWWVALPFAALAAWVAWGAARGRLPSRRAMNVVSSLMLLAYFLATASLGIFWVANQQLPVFDWHYLFGYATVALVLLHLAFNARIVVAHFSRRRDAPPAQPDRAWWLAAATAAVCAGLGYLAGTRHGASELSVHWAGTTGARAAPGDAIERYHAYSSHSRASVATRAPIVDWGDPPAPFKSYPAAPFTPLPAPATGGRATSTAVAAPWPVPGHARLDLAGLSTALFHAVGVTARRSGWAYRASPSSGALFPAEVYVTARDVDGLEPGVYHYDPDRHGLARLRAGALAPHELGAPDDPLVARAPATVVVSAVFRRSGHKYRDRAYRYVAADVGHLLENLRVAAGETGAYAWFPPAFDETQAGVALGLDGHEEAPMALCALLPAAYQDAYEAVAEAHRAWVAREMAYAPAPPPEPSASALGATALAHRATSLVRRPAPPPVTSAIALPGASPATGPVLDAIAARRSRRRFAAGPLALADLAGTLRHATAASTVWSRAVRVYVVAVRVESIPPGAYRYDPTAHTLERTRHGDLGDEARTAGLHQDVVGNAAAVLVWTFDTRALGADGPRGYRHAFFEAGHVAERVYLEAEARGLAACSVGAFYDEDAARLIGVTSGEEWVAHFQALGPR